MDIAEVTKCVMQEKYKCVSFDIFDTLLKRTVEKPVDVFELIEKSFINDNYKKKRLRAEGVARKNSASEDVTIDEIYNYFGSSSDVSNELKQLEQTTELDIVVANKPIVNLLNACCKAGKYIIIVSDMYLKRDTLSKMLDKIGVEKYDRLYISGEMGKTKLSGHIWKDILVEIEQEGISSKQIIHIGDNYNNDYLMVKRNGIDACFLEEKNDTHLYWKKEKSDINQNHFYHTVKNTLFSETDNSTAYRLGYTWLGPVLYQYSMWLHKQEEMYDSILFVSREGYFLKIIYEAIYGVSNKCKYIHLNKNILRLPALYINPLPEVFIKFFPSVERIQIFELVEMLGMNRDDTDVTEVVKKYFASDTVSLSKDYLYTEQFVKFFKDCAEIGKERWKLQYDNLKLYINQIVTGKKVALVNNSIEASVQSILMDIMSLDITGIHFVISKKGYERIGGNCKVWFGENCCEWKKKVFAAHSILFEHMLFPGEGTALRLDKKGNHINVVTDSSMLENSNKLNVVEIQRGAMDYIALASKTLPMSVANKTILDGMCELYLMPQLEDVKLLSKLSDYELHYKQNVCLNIENSSMFERIQMLCKKSRMHWIRGSLKMNGASDMEMRIYKVLTRIKWSLNRYYK